MTIDDLKALIVQEIELRAKDIQSTQVREQRNPKTVQHRNDCYQAQIDILGKLLMCITNEATFESSINENITAIAQVTKLIFPYEIIGNIQYSDYMVPNNRSLKWFGYSEQVPGRNETFEYDGITFKVSATDDCTCHEEVEQGLSIYVVYAHAISDQK